MSTAAKAVAIGIAEEGEVESPYGSNKTKYGRWYGLDGNPWCAMFVSWVLHKAGLEGIKFAYTPSGVDYFKSKGWEVKEENTKPGDIVFFDFPDSTFRVQHVGIAIKPERDGYVTCVEGNTSSGAGGSQDNGGGVFIRKRPLSHVAFVGRPPYTTDVDYIVRVGDGPKRRFETQKMAMQRVRAALKRGKRVKVRPVDG